MKTLLLALTFLIVNSMAEEAMESPYYQVPVTTGGMTAVVKDKDNKFAQFEKPLPLDGVLKLEGTFQMVMAKAIPMNKQNKIENPIGLVTSAMNKSELDLSTFTNASGEKIEPGGVYIIQITATQIEPAPKQNVSQLIVSIEKDDQKPITPNYEEISKSLD